MTTPPSVAGRFIAHDHAIRADLRELLDAIGYLDRKETP